jgi:hypothetical protein
MGVREINLYRALDIVPRPKPVGAPQMRRPDWSRLINVDPARTV